MISVRKIKEGMTGSEAAYAIYNNDKELAEKVASCEDALEAYKAYANQLVVSGEVTAQVVQVSGNTADAVMSQAAVTNMFEGLGDIAKLSDSGITDSVIDNPGAPASNATYAMYAASDTQGHSLTAMYYTLKEYETRITALERLFDRIELLEQRMDTAETNIKALQDYIISNS